MHFGQQAQSGPPADIVTSGMKTLSSKASIIRAHTWKDIGGFFGLILDGAFFVMITVAGLFMILLATILVLLDYLVRPFLALMSLFHRKAHGPG